MDHFDWSSVLYLISQSQIQLIPMPDANGCMGYKHPVFYYNQQNKMIIIALSHMHTQTTSQY